MGGHTIIIILIYDNCQFLTFENNFLILDNINYLICFLLKK